MKLIPLTQGKFAMVDNGDYESLSLWKWYAAYAPNAKSFYAVWCYMPNGRKGPKITIKMHRQIVGCEDGVPVDHVNADTLDNQRTNLRACTVGQNARNQKTRSNNSSGFKGVSRKNNRWVARIMVDGKCIQIGSFIEIIDAARAYNQAATRHHGEYARLNIMEMVA